MVLEIFIITFVLTLIVVGCIRLSKRVIIKSVDKAKYNNSLNKLNISEGMKVNIRNDDNENARYDADGHRIR